MLYRMEMVPKPGEAKNEGLTMIFGFIFHFLFWVCLVYWSVNELAQVAR